MTKRQDKVNQALDKYTEARKQSFLVKHGTKDKEAIDALLAEKHKAMNEAFGYLTQRERGDDTASKIQKVINSGVEGCYVGVMQSYFEDGNKISYFNCLELQKAALSKVFQSVYVDTTVIIDTEEGLSSCHSDYFYNGVCNSIVD